MKKNVLLNLIGLVALISGFILFLLKYKEIGVGFTLFGLVVYLYNKIGNKN